MYVLFYDQSKVFCAEYLNPIPQWSMCGRCNSADFFPQKTPASRSGYLRTSLIRYNAVARRDGREAEGGGLLNRYRAKSSIEGSNPSLSARQSTRPFRLIPHNANTATDAGNLLLRRVRENLCVELSADNLFW